jgi:hypothetical protein
MNRIMSVFNGRLLPVVYNFLLSCSYDAVLKCCSKSQEAIHVANKYDIIMFTGGFFTTLCSSLFSVNTFSTTVNCNQNDKIFEMFVFINSYSMCAG